MVRIRKNLKVSPLQFCSNVAPEDLQPHICKLNQSPWDLNPLPLDSSPHQVSLTIFFVFFSAISISRQICENPVPVRVSSLFLNFISLHLHFHH